MSNHPTIEASELTELRRLVEELQKRLSLLETKPAAPSHAPTSAPAAPAKEEIPWFVIMAAVASVVKERHRVVSVQLSGLPPLNIWAFEGRRAIFYSHQPR